MTPSNDSQNILLNHANPDDLPSKAELLNDLVHRIESGASISYSQNFEDIILSRIFSGKSDGVYVDVGCFAPYRKSITCHFHKKGWHGMNLDVCDENIARFKIHRPKDDNICVAVGSQAGQEEFFILPGTTRSTKDETLGSTYIERGQNVKQESRTVTTLDSLLEEYNYTHIDFLSIDVEGAEADVLSGLKFERIRPKIILAEATVPETNTPNWSNWEPILEKAGYTFVYFDGLNRFYADQPDQSIIDAVKLPPNYFDNFIRYEQLLAALARP